MSEYTPDKRLDAVLLKVKKVNTAAGKTVPLPLEESFWQGVEALRDAGVDLEYTQGVTVKKTVFARLAAQLTRIELLPEQEPLRNAEFERLWALEGRVYGPDHHLTWWQLLAVSWANFSCDEGKRLYAPFVEWGIRGLQDNPTTDNDQSMRFFLDAAICMDRPDLVSKIQHSRPDYQIPWHEKAGRGSLKMVQYYDEQGWDFNSPPPGSPPFHTKPLVDMLREGPEGRSSDGQKLEAFLKQRHLTHSLPSPGTLSRKGPRF